MIKESKFCSKFMKKHFNKEPVMTKNNDEYFKSSTELWICVNIYVNDVIKVRYHCHISGKCRGSTHRDINVKSNHKIPVVFYNLQNYDSHLIMEELGKFNLKRNVIPNGVENI